MNLTKITPTGKGSTYEVADAIFSAKVNESLIAQAVRVYLANKRQGTSKVQSRSEVSRTKAKVYRQKGTGNARHGSKNAPIFVGGGVAHGPTGLQNWSLTLSKKQKRAALIAALSLQSGNIYVSDIPLETSGKTKYAAQFLKSVGSAVKNYLLVLTASADMAKRSFENLPQVTIQMTSSLNVIDVVSADTIIFTSEAITELEKRLTPIKKEVVKPTKAPQKSTPKTSAASKIESVEVEKKPTKVTTKKEGVKTDVAKKVATKKVTAKSTKTPVKKTAVKQK